MRPKTFSCKDKTEISKVVGFIAQESEEDLPEAHTIAIKKIPNFYQVGILTNVIFEEETANASRTLSATITNTTGVELEYKDGVIVSKLSVFTDSITDDSIINIESIDVVNKTMEVTGDIKRLIEDEEGNYAVSFMAKLLMRD